MIVYKIKNKLDGKIYIGQTINTLEKRWKEHTYGWSNCRYLKYAIKKYGKDNFEVLVIARCSSEDEMNHREAYYIKLFKSLAPNGYNLMTGGDKTTLSEVSCKKSSETHKKLAAAGKNSGCFKKGQKAWNLGIPHSKVTKIRLSKVNKGKHNSLETEFKKGHIAPKTAFQKGCTSPNKGKKRTVINGRVCYRYL